MLQVWKAKERVQAVQPAEGGSLTAAWELAEAEPPS
jgi:hypothetical protein